VISRDKPVILVNHLLEPPDRITGITSFLFALLPELLKREAFEYVLATTWTPEKLPKSILDSGIRIIKVPFQQSQPLNLAAQMITVPHLMRRTGAGIEFNCNPIGCFWPTWPRVITVHDLYFDVSPHSYQLRHRLWWRLFFPLSLMCSSSVICVSGSTRDDLAHNYPRSAKKAVVVHEASALVIEDEPIPARTTGMIAPYAIYVGNISPNKNPGVLAAALKILEKRRRPVTVYHVGRDDTNLLARANAATDLQQPIRTVGALSNRALAGAYIGATCIVAPSTHEGFCLPVLEAQAYCLPVVCSDIPVLREVAGKGALFFDPSSPNALADCLERVFQDDNFRQQLVAAGRSNASQYSWTRAAREIEVLFASTAECNSSR
jgi:glycosyltransferase involved in cell wall biosynthesis